MPPVPATPAFPLFRLLLALLWLLATPLARAQPAPDDAADLPVPARLSIVEGTASFWRPGDQDWSPAQVNMALAAGDTIYAGDGATVEIQIGAKSYVRVMANSQIAIARQDAGLLQLTLAAGNASLDLRGMSKNQLVEIDTPNAAFAVNGSGYYRADFRDGTSRFVVRRNGRATLGLRDGYNRVIAPGEQIIVRGATDLTAEIAAAPAPDTWDRWNDARSDYYDQAASNRYVPPDVYGAADLDQYGTWREVPEYGNVWMPTVAPGWAPYSVGDWRWDPVYEWTWVDRQPWGWAPSHYGRWVSISGRWAWAPGPRVARPVYLPAVVAFVGFGSGPQLGWVALSWGEPVVPWWGRREMRGRPSWGGWGGPRIVNNTVVQHNTVINVNNISYRNSHLPQAVVAVRQEEFGRGHEHHDLDHHFRFAGPEDGKMQPMQGVLPVRANRGSVSVAPPIAPPMRMQPGVGSTRELAPERRGQPAGGAAMPATPQIHRDVRPETRTEAPPMSRQETPIQMHRDAPTRVDAAPVPRQEPPPRMNRDSRPEPHFPAPVSATPQTAPPTVNNSAPARELQAPVMERHRVDERREVRQPQAAPRVEVAPTMPRQEPPPQRAITIQQAPAREMHAPEAPRKVEAAPEHKQEHPHRQPNDRPDSPRGDDSNQHR